MDDLQEELPEVSRIAFASTGRNRDPWLAALALDGRIGRMVLGASEPMLGQVRLAWWRDQLGKPIDDRPRGDPLLDLEGPLLAAFAEALLREVAAGPAPPPLDEAAEAARAAELRAEVAARRASGGGSQSMVGAHISTSSFLLSYKKNCLLLPFRCFPIMSSLFDS